HARAGGGARPLAARGAPAAEPARVPGGDLPRARADAALGRDPRLRPAPAGPRPPRAPRLLPRRGSPSRLEGALRAVRPRPRRDRTWAPRPRRALHPDDPRLGPLQRRALVAGRVTAGGTSCRGCGRPEPRGWPRRGLRARAGRRGPPRPAAPGAAGR